MNDMLTVDFATAKDWLYTGVGIMPNDKDMRDYLAANDWTYPIVARAGADSASMAAEVEEVHVIRDMVLAFEDPIKCVEAMASPDVKIVSLTITEFGYRVPLTKGDFKLIERALNGELGSDKPLDEDSMTPTTFGVICASAGARFRRKLRPFTLMSCDNLPHNGDVCKRRMTNAAEELVCAGLCSASLNDFVAWLQTEMRYPSTMVDRITPATSWEDIATLPQKFGFEDKWPVMCEPYKHWVLEDNFVDDARPAWESVGAVLVPDVIPHELMKVRLLNVTHSAMCYVGLLAGCTHVHEAVTHSKIRTFLEYIMAEEIGATLRANPEMGGNEVLLHNIPKYSNEILTRFENVAVKDTLDRIAMDGSEKFRVQGKSVVTEGIALGLPMNAFALYVAAWAYFVQSEVIAGNQVKDMGAAMVTAPFQEGGSGLPAFLGMEEIFGELTKDEAWKERVTTAHRNIVEFGIGHTIDDLIGVEVEVDAPATPAR